MTGLALSKPWIAFEADTDADAGDRVAIPAQLGVYEIGDDEGGVVRIGYAGGREPFGMRSAIEAERAAGSGTRYRYELTHGYLTRWEELLMLHKAEHGRLPPGNADRVHPVGRLRPM